MLNITPTLHAGLLAVAAILSLLFAGIILARNPRSSPARMHAIYGGLAAWWFWCMSMVAASSSTAELHYWARLAHLSLGVLPAAMLHLNVATANLWREYRTTVSYHYGIAIAVTLFCLSWPNLFGTPQQFSWGPYPSYTIWGLVPFLFFAIAMAEVINLYRNALSVAEDPVHRKKLKAFLHGNIIASLALVDFLSPFGFAIYPIGFIVLTFLHVGTVFGSIRYRLIEITPEIAASHILDSIPEGVLVLDSQNKIRLANIAASRMLGRPHSDLIGQDFRDIAPQPLQFLAELSPLNLVNHEIQFAPADQQPQFIVRTS
ncbi:MAG: PAS domain-containing protein, partial [Gammaproteobacteria bacterium]|nr:PAS domain-containing protein [Gammaproteobacteria bacterium]